MILFKLQNNLTINIFYIKILIFFYLSSFDIFLFIYNFFFYLISELFFKIQNTKMTRK